MLKCFAPAAAGGKASVVKANTTLDKEKAPKKRKTSLTKRHGDDDDGDDLDMNKILYDLEHKQTSLSQSPSLKAKHSKEMSVVLQAAAKQTATVRFLFCF